MLSRVVHVCNPNYQDHSLRLPPGKTLETQSETQKQKDLRCGSRGNTA
jgi:hypothetical protein